MLVVPHIISSSLNFIPHLQLIISNLVTRLRAQSEPMKVQTNASLCPREGLFG